MIKYNLLLCFFFANILSFAQTNPCNSDVKNIDYTKEKADTTIILENGTELTFNRCEFFDIRNCFEVKEIRTLAAMQQNGLNTIDNKGNILLTCGMVKLNFKSGDCTEECLQVAVKIRILMLTNPCINNNNTNRLYKVTSNGTWEPLNEPVKEIVGANGKNYFEFYTKCGAAFNCDKKIQTITVKFKSKSIKNLSSLQVTSQCPIINLAFAPKRRSNIIYAKLPCTNPDSLLIKINGQDKNGTKVDIEKPLSAFTSKNTCTSCTPISNKIVRNILGIFKTRERFIYRKYIVE